MNRVGILKETLHIVCDGQYVLDGNCIKLQLSPRKYTDALYLSENQVKIITKEEQLSKKYPKQHCEVRVTNRDSFGAAITLSRMNVKVLVLNFANPVNPGGGVRYGVDAQEEDLCRNSTLLFSLESEKASEFYHYHQKNCDSFASHAAILSPSVEVIRDSNNELLPYTVEVAVLTCAAPMLGGILKHPISQVEYENILYQRILGILSIAKRYQYEKLVLGAWGCGAFRNNPQLIAKLFEKALTEFDGSFNCVEFAVLCKDVENYNFTCFHKVLVLHE